MAQKLFRLLDSRRTWGSVDVYPSRYGITRYRLVVFPPGMSQDERRLLRGWRTWPIWGTALFLAAEIWLTNTTTGGWALAMSIALWLSSGAVAFALAGGTRTRVRTLIAHAMNGVHDEAAANRLAEMRILAAALLAADERRAAGALTELEHETVCWQVYRQMARFDDVPAVTDQDQSHGV
jgi:hypothetical protein